jgi:8-oxo-dGTP pyrophosphatase MutT (NUDIX family)
MAGLPVGRIRTDALPLLHAYDDIFDFASDGVSLSPRLGDCAARSEALLRVARDLDTKDGVMPPWMDEDYPVFADPARPEFTSGGTAQPLAHITRSAVLFFGLPAWGVHLNGYVENPSGGGDKNPSNLKVWLARRGPNCFDFPGKLDNVVAGGQPAHLSADDNLAKESLEEAGIESGLIAQARSQGCLSYLVETPFGLSPGNIFCYDLKLPPGFTPRSLDSEVSEFLLLPAAEVMEMLDTTAEALHFKPISALVILDFLLRYGVLDGAPDRAQIAAALGREA